MLHQRTQFEPQINHCKKKLEKRCRGETGWIRGHLYGFLLTRTV